MLAVTTERTQHGASRGLVSECIVTIHTSLGLQKLRHSRIQPVAQMVDVHAWVVKGSSVDSTGAASVQATAAPPAGFPRFRSVAHPRSRRRYTSKKLDLPQTKKNSWEYEPPHLAGKGTARGIRATSGGNAPTGTGGGCCASIHITPRRSPAGTTPPACAWGGTVGRPTPTPNPGGRAASSGGTLMGCGWAAGMATSVLLQLG